MTVSAVQISRMPWECCAAGQAVLRELLVPRQWKPSEDRSFFLDAEQVSTLCDQAERVFAGEPTVLRLRGERPCAPLEKESFHENTHDARIRWRECGKTS